MGKSKTSKGKGKKAKSSKVATDTQDPVLTGAAALGLEILTLEEAATLLRISADALKADAEKGSVPGRFVGGEWRFLKRSLDQWFGFPPSTPYRLSDIRPLEGMERIVKSSPSTQTTLNSSQLSTVGSMADDDSLAEIVEEIYRRRAVED